MGLRLDPVLAHRAERNAAQAFGEFLAGAAPSLMQMDSWNELSNPRDLTKIFGTP